MTRRTNGSPNSNQKQKQTGAEAALGDSTKIEEHGEHRSFAVSMFILLILVAAAALRSIYLDLKPPHYDEGINGFFVAKMWKEGFYRYDPTNFHGPLYFYILQFAELIFGHGIVGFRFINGLISLACVAQLIRLRRFLGNAALWAAALMAVSAGSVFYSRYAIHESLFVFFQILFVYAFFLWEEERSRRSVALMALSVFGDFAVKETFFIFYGTWAIALVCVRLYEAVRHPVLKEKVRSKKKRADPAVERAEVDGLSYWQQAPTPNDWGIIFGAGFLICVFFFNGFFLNPVGYRDMFSAFLAWSKTGTTGSGHEKPMMYWLQLMGDYEWPALGALALSLPMFFFVGRKERILNLVAIGTFLAYTIIPYKTPWLILNLLWPLALVFGITVRRLGRVTNWSVANGARAIAVASILAMLPVMLRLNFKDFANKNERYVYVQSTDQMKTVIDEIDLRVKTRPETLNMRLFVLLKDTWPLPWVFGMYPNLIYGRAESAETAGAHVILVDGSMREVLEAKLRGHFFRQPFQIRDSYENGFAYLDVDMFKDIVPLGTEIFEPLPKVEGR